MIKVNRRSKAARRTEGPSLGAFLTRTGITVRVIEDGERPTLPGATVRATGDAREAVSLAAEMVAERIKAYARKPIVITILA